MIITKGELMTMANSTNAEERKRAFKIYRDWIKAAPKLSFQERLNTTERHLLEQVFASKGMKVNPRA